MSTTMMPVDKARAQIYRKMTPATQQVAKEFEDKISKGVVSQVKVNYDIGARIAEMVDDTNESTYGSSAVKQLADYLNVDGGEQGLYNRMGFARAFTREYVTQQCAIPMANGNYLTLYHWLQLMKVEDEAKRDKMLNKVRKENMSGNDLEKEIRAGGAGSVKHARQGGRKPKAPTSPIAGLQKTFEIANKFARWEEVAGRTTFSAIEEMSADKVDQKLLEKTEACLEMVTSAHEKAGEMKEALEANVERLKEVMDKKAEDAAESYTEEAEDEEEEAPAPKAKTGKKKKKSKKPVAAE